MSNFRYIFEPYKGRQSRTICPQCKDKNRTFVPYIDTETGERLEDFGKCERLQKCGYWRKPSIDNQETQTPYNPTIKKPLGEIDYNLVKPTLDPQYYHKNGLIQFLYKKFNISTVNEWCEKLFIGTNRKNGATIFWHCDQNWKFRQGQVIEYLPDGHRDKSKKQTSAVAILQSFKKLDDSHDYKQCIFGEHLLREDKGFKAEKIGLFESPKTALIAAIDGRIELDTFLSYISITGLSESKAYPIRNLLIGKKIYLFNDYHFEARMVNGILPMKKEAGKMSLTGEDDLTYQNKAQLLKMLTRGNAEIKLIDSPRPNDESGEDLADLIFSEPYLLDIINEQIETSEEPENLETCNICAGEFSPFFVKDFQNMRVCIDCITDLYQPPPNEEKPPATVSELVARTEKQYPVLKSLIETFDLAPTTENLNEI